MTGATKTIGHSHLECGGKRSATPLWLAFVSYPSQDQPLKPKRRRASLAAALHRVPGHDHSFNHTHEERASSPQPSPPEEEREKVSQKRS